ncbi:MAG: hypothetical protein LC099_12540 [Anaerolineales bacterium]|nr:hypothetical protein [Anaerolineales bacterium]
MNIQDKAVLVDLKISSWAAQATDHKLSDEINITKTGSTNSGRYVKKLLPANDQIKQIQQIANKLRKEFQAATLDWEGSSRLLPIEKLDDWVKTYNHYQNLFNTAVQNFVNAYPESINKAELALGELFNREDYPDDIASYFAVAQKIKPIPTDDFRTEIDSEVIRQLREEAKQATEEQTNKATKAFLEKLLLDINRIINATGPDAKRTRNSLFDTLRGTLNNAKAFNFNSNAELNALIEEGFDLIDGLSTSIPKEQKSAINVQATNLVQRIQSYGKPI